MPQRASCSSKPAAAIGTLHSHPARPRPDARPPHVRLGLPAPIPSRTSTTGASRRCAVRFWVAHPPSTSWPIPAAIPATMTAGRKRARVAGPTPTCCPIFDAARLCASGEDTWRGGAGPLGTEFARTQDPLYEAWLEAAKACGYPLTSDYNGSSRRVSAAANTPFATAGGRPPPTPSSSRRAGERNLTVVDECPDHPRHPHGTRATGIEYLKDGAIVRAEAATRR